MRDSRSKAGGALARFSFPPLAHPHLTALALYAAATFAVLSAVLIDPAHRTFASFSGDNFADFWNLWWVHRAFAEGQTIFHTNLLYFPAGTSLSFTEFGPLYGVLSAPFFAMADSIATAALMHNLWTAATFVLTGYATFLLARRFTGEDIGALFAGFLVAFAPYRIHHLEHVNLLSMYWIAFTWLAVMAWILPGEAPGVVKPRRPGVWRIAALIACGAGLSGTSFTNLAITATLIAFWLLWTVLFDRRRLGRGWLVRAAAGGGLVALGSLPFLWEWLVWLVKSRAQVWNAEELARWSPDLFGFVSPPSRGLLGGLSSAWAGGLHGVGGDEVYLGLLFLILAAVGLRRAGRTGLVLGLTALAGLLLALGPGTWIAGKHLGGPVSLYAILEKVFPFIGACRVPTRFMPMVFLALAPLAAAGFVAVRSRWGRLALLAVPLALVESLVVPRAVDAVRAESLYRELRDDPTHGAVFELTLQRENPNLYAFHQIVHRRPIVGGHLPRVSLPALALDARLDLRRRLTRGETAAAALDDLREIGAAFFVLHRAGAPTEAWQQMTGFYEAHAEVWSRSRDRIVYRLAREGAMPGAESETGDEEGQ